MMRGPAILAVSLCALLAQACSQLEPAPKEFTLVSQTADETKHQPGQTKNKEGSLEAAEEECKEETKKKGIKSIAAIFSRLRPGSADQDYIACMKARGFEVKS